ncbi:MAG TPA: hypothetical protein VE631_08940 [Alphaproteobacteria bacterium]|nr:hypothetical protein [Alphaproteobacteria bacterium]
MNDTGTWTAKPEGEPAPRGKPGDCEIIERPNLLKKKVGDGQGFDPATLVRAEQVIEMARQGYIDRVRAQLHDCENMFKSMRSQHQHEFSGIWDIVHVIRGEAGTMNYPLLTRLGNSLCNLISTIKQPNARDLKTVAAHLAAMRVVVNNRLEGDSPEVTARAAHALNDVMKRSEAAGW